MYYIRLRSGQIAERCAVLFIPPRGQASSKRSTLVANTSHVLHILDAKTCQQTASAFTTTSLGWGQFDQRLAAGLLLSVGCCLPSFTLDHYNGFGRSKE